MEGRGRERRPARSAACCGMYSSVAGHFPAEKASRASLTQPDSSAAGEAQSAVGLIRDRGECAAEAEVDSKCPRVSAPASQGSEIKDDPKASGWTKR